MLGKYLKTRYYSRLLNGNPRKLYVRSADSEKCLESAEALVAGLNPPNPAQVTAGIQTTEANASGRSSSWWSWFTGLNGDQTAPLGALWQPKAIHTTVASSDDLLSSESSCLRQDAQQLVWKNTTTYAQLLNQFRHDLQTLRQNTGLEFEDDLEMLSNIEESLRSRKAWQMAQSPAVSQTAEQGPNLVPTWYTNTYADRLGHIADLTAAIRFSLVDTQRLYAGRLVHELLEMISIKVGQIRDSSPLTKRNIQKTVSQMIAREKLVSQGAQKANVIVYMTDKQHLTALLSALQIYSSQPNYGTALLIELHYDPNQQQHFLRLYLVGGAPQYDQMPEPVRMNPGACMDSPSECSYRQFERNLRSSALSRVAWRRLCLEHEISLDADNGNLMIYPQTNLPAELVPYQTTPPIEPEITTQPSLALPTTAATTNATTATSPAEDLQATGRDINIDQSQTVSPTEFTTEGSSNYVQDDDDEVPIDKLDNTLIVGPTHAKPTTTTMTPTTPTPDDQITNEGSTSTETHPIPDSSTQTLDDASSQADTVASNAETTANTQLPILLPVEENLLTSDLVDSATQQPQGTYYNL